MTDAPIEQANTTRTAKTSGERGAGFVEYGLLLALMAFALLTLVDALGEDTKDSIDDSASSVANF